MGIVWKSTDIGGPVQGNPVRIVAHVTGRVRPANMLFMTLVTFISEDAALIMTVITQAIVIQAFRGIIRGLVLAY